VEALRVVVVALPARRPLVDGHNLVIVFFVLRESGEGEKKRRRKKWERNALRQLLLIFFVASSRLISSPFSVTYPEPVPDCRVDLDRLSV